jgi:zinc transport system permease protein
MSYLFGSLLFVSWDYVALVGVLDLLIVATVVLLFRDFQAVSFDEEFAEVAGLRVERILLALLTLVSLAIVTLIRVVGIILVIALLTIPAAIGRHWADDLKRMMVIAVALSATCTSAGLFLSYAAADLFGLSLPPGPLIILLAALLYAISRLILAISPPGSSGG